MEESGETWYLIEKKVVGVLPEEKEQRNGHVHEKIPYHARGHRGHIFEGNHIPLELFRRELWSPCLENVSWLVESRN